ncbi:MAG: hypothetical protein A3B89_01285 [Candidatus Buchananbacteria bacterium RIFCSPHIGHO2_02_FULL_40_13]|uniref:DUF11 domain-containing protein n=1 Tax=Candidatus Buchananbacteria bacterium RIFCSPLOWO2_01_FULL_39_33 TaxID=1797543 RepID=A0A1G1YL74_9BACT|nr:MAG: hypothetical protein A2820_03440 [Candidatus Buchananbacteria bacterium RIFCSPHIGHO2_01_FULL_40_35]OGY50123.1 MAG: hypothetical protein A3B89_01285 [Candidatus Buchananbacteria bacterium RIFCSPHIGHO2_02_FULL_40_13]OGY53105.1 MAG: hypothetical protein A3A02_00100 [Candidatus Buchananbacteria bacterium RIFCSPLOWO2_01_FULL_39_33]
MSVKNYLSTSGDQPLNPLIKSKKDKIATAVKDKNKKGLVTTMQDDLAKLMAKKNRAGKSLEFKPAGERQPENSEIQRKLTEVYTDGDGEIPDLTRLEKNDKSPWQTLLYSLIGVFSVLFVVAIAGFWFFSNWNTDNFTNERITLKIDTPITIISGQEGIYTVTITNKEKVDLYNLELELLYPENFIYLDAVPKAGGDKNNSWSFSVLKSGESQKIELKGKIIAALKSTQTFRGWLNFKPANLNANFKQETIVDVMVSASVFGLDITGPDKTLANQEVEYVIKYENSSEEDFTNLQIVTVYPESFVLGSAEPSSEKEMNNTWNLAELKAGTRGEIKVKGDYSAAESGGNRDFTARLQLKKDGDYYPQSEETLVTEVIKDQLSMQLIVNGSSEDQPISFGDLLVYTLNYKNTGEENLENIQIKANLNSEILDWNTLKDENKGVREDNSIIWTGRRIPKLLKLGAGEEGQIDWQIRVQDASAINDINVGKFSVESFIEAKAQQTGKLTGESVVSTKILVNSVNSDLTMSAEARYYNEDNVPLGLGPIEPRVGELSTYNIKLALSNNLHRAENIQVKAKLPSNVFWSNRETHDQGDLIYNAVAGEVIWNISNLDKSAQPVIATFNIDIKPTDNDRGRILILLSNINLTAKDSETGAAISKEVKAITTAFDDPILGQTKGIVQ